MKSYKYHLILLKKILCGRGKEGEGKYVRIYYEKQRNEKFSVKIRIS